MQIVRVVWLPHVVDKLASKHSVAQQEVEDLLYESARFRFVERDHIAGEDLYAALGQTHHGRYLIVYFVLKQDSSAIVVSARTMSDQERRLYERK